MPAKKPTQRERELEGENEELRARLAEAEETLRAIHEGEVDAVIVSGSRGEQVFSLAGSESVYRLIVETMAEAALTIGLDGTVLHCNAQFGQLLQRPLEQVVGHSLLEFVAEGNRAGGSSLLIAAQQQPVRQRLVFQAADGGQVPAHVSANVLNALEGPSICVVASDLTELENSTELVQELRSREEELHKLNRMLMALSRSSQAMVRAQTEAEYLQEVCRIVVDHCRHAMVWVGYAENDETRSVRPVAHAGFEEGYLETLRVTWSDSDRGRGPTGTAIRTGQPVSCRNTQTDPRFLPWRQEATRRGYASSLALPLLSQGAAFGAITIYSTQPDAFGEQEVRLLTELAEDLAHGIAMIRLREARDRAEQAMQASEQRYRSLVELSPEAVIVHQDGRFVYANPVALSLYGAASPDDLLGRPVTDLIHPDDRDLVQSRMGKATEGGQVPLRELRALRLDGQAVHVESTAAPVDFAGRPAAQVVIRDITDRKRAEEALARERDLLQSVLNSAGKAHLVYLDRDFNFVRVNGTYAATCGYRPEEMIGKNHFALYPRAENEAIFRRVRDTGEPFEVRDKPFEFPDQPERGVTYWDWTLIPVKDAVGQVTGLIFSLFETTARKQAEEALRESEEHYRSLFSGMTEGFAIHEILTDEQGTPVDYRFLDVNPAFERLTGLRRQDVVGRTHNEVLPGDDPKWLDVYGRVALTGTPVQFENYSPALNRWYEVYAYRPAPQQFAVIFMDISQRKNAEESMRAALARAEEGENLLKAIMEHVPEGITVAYGPDANIRMVSRFGQEVLGGGHHDRTAKEVASQWTVYCSDGETPMETERLPLLRAIRGNEVVRNVELVQVNANGERLPLLCNAGPIRDASGRAVGGVVAWRDITEIKRAQDVLRQAKDELEQRVQERTAELRERSEQLRLLASELTLAEQRERRRLAEVLHDNLQQLLVGAKYRLIGLNRSNDEAAKRAGAEVQELLDQSIECSRTLTGELSPPILHEGGLVPALEWLAVWMEQKHGLAVELQLADNAEPASEDLRVLLFQSVRELLFNTVKHAHVNKAQVSLRRPDEHIEIVVSDQGSGFDPHAAMHRTDKLGGFGLFSIRERLDLLGGELQIDSVPGEGSRFTLVAPIGKAASREEAAGPPLTLAAVKISRIGPEAPLVEGAAGTTERRIRVLLVDDHVVVRQGLSHLLRSEPDIEVVGEASDGPTAIAMIRQLRPGVVTLDINMPGMDGLEAARIIRSQFPDVRVIGLSMFAEAERAKAMREAGAVAYLTKTGPADALLSAIRACASAPSPAEP